MTPDLFDEGLAWISGLSGDRKVKAGMIVSWQFIAATLGQLVARFTELSSASARPEMARHREVQLKKLIIGMLYEMVACLNVWTGELNRAGLMDEDLKEKKRTFEVEYDKIGLQELKEIRNGVAFHFTDYLTDPDAIVETYAKVDKIPIESLNAMLRAALDCGYAMRKKVHDSM